MCEFVCTTCALIEIAALRNDEREREGEMTNEKKKILKSRKTHQQKENDIKSEIKSKKEKPKEENRVIKNRSHLISNNKQILKKVKKK